MNISKWNRAATNLWTVLCTSLALVACAQGESNGTINSITTAEIPEFLEMGGAKSVTSFFITSIGVGDGGKLGGLAGADAHCQALAAASRRL